MEPGEGSAVLQLQVNEKDIRLGVSICQDYLHTGHSFAAEGRNLDVVAIPTLTRTIAPFLPDEPRDFVRMIANHSIFGGSTICIPHLDGPAFCDQSGSTPMRAGEEAVCIVEYDKYQSRPSSTFSTQNRMVCRASLVPTPSLFEAQVIDTMSSLPIDPGSNNEAMTALDLWIDRTDKQVHLTGINECLRTYKRLGMSGALREPDRKLLTTHLPMSMAKSSPDLRMAQATQIVEALRRLTHANAPRTFFTAQGEYADLVASIKPADRPGSTLPNSGEASMETYAAFGLGTFQSDKAIRTVSYQLDLLRSFSKTFRSDVSLCYRLSTVENALTADVDPRFDVILGGARKQSDLEQDIEGFMRSARSVFLSAWDCYTSAAKIDTPGKHLYSFLPADSGHRLPPTVREDWGAVVDVLRAQLSPLCLEISCTPASPEDDIEEVAAHPPQLLHNLSNVVTYPINSNVNEFSNFLSSQEIQGLRDKPSLVLRVAISSANPVGEALLNTVGSMMLGHDQFEVVHNALGDMGFSAKSAGFLVRPDEALRVLHPPHGHIAGRGLGSKSALKVHAKDIPLAQSGCVLGRATAARPHVDTDFDVAIDDESRLRHVYVIGKTGSGKTNLLKNMVRQDIQNGAGIAIIDPHGDLSEYALGHCGKRAADTILLDFGDPEYLPILNPLSLDVTTEEQYLLAVEELLELFSTRTFHEWYGPRFEDTIRLALDTLRHNNPHSAISLLDVPNILRDKGTRKAAKTAASTRSDLAARWRVFESMRDTEQAEVVNWVLAKFAELEQSLVMRHTLSARSATLSIEKAISSSKILIARLPEVTIGNRAASFIGALLVARISRHIVEAQARVDRRQYYLYVDEFQKFVTSGFETLIPEARKFRLGLVLAHQNTEQLVAFNRFEGRRDSSVLSQILGNVGSMVAFRMGSRDADVLSSDLSLPKSDLLRIGRYEAVARIVSDGVENDPVSIAVYDSNDEPGYPEARERIRGMLRHDGTNVPVTLVGNDSGWEEVLIDDVDVPQSDELIGDAPLPSRDSSKVVQAPSTLPHLDMPFPDSEDRKIPQSGSSSDAPDENRLKATSRWKRSRDRRGSDE
jgi:hypothetical protein